MSKWPTIKVCGNGSERKPDVVGRWFYLPILPEGEYVLIPKDRIRKEWLCTKRGTGRFCDTNNIFHVRCGFVLIVEADDEQDE